MARALVLIAETYLLIFITRRSPSPHEADESRFTISQSLIRLFIDGLSLFTWDCQQVMLPGPTGQSDFSTTTVQWPTRAAMAPSAASCGATRAPTTPTVKGTSIKVLPSSLTIARWRILPS
jgi:hypothetical protein